MVSENHVLKAKTPNEHARSLLRVKISLCSEETSSNLNIFLTHLEHLSEKVRVQQIQEILGIIEEWKAKESLVQDEGYLLIGDLNALSQQDYTETQWNSIIELKKEKNWLEDGSAVPKSLVIPFLESRGLKDIFKAPGKEELFTAWTHRPTMKIDYMFASPEFLQVHVLSKFYVFPSKASDHFPLVLEFQ